MKKHVLFLLLILLVVGQVKAQRTVYYEGFTNNEKRWTNKETADYNAYLYDGHYFVTHKRAVGSWVFWNDCPFNSNKDFEITTAVEKIYGAKENYFGLEFGRKDAENRYSFIINTNGTYILNFPDGASSGVVNTKLVKPYAANEFRIVKRGESIAFYLNGEQLEQRLFQPFPGQRIAFYISKKSKIKVDFIKVSNDIQPIYEARTVTEDFTKKRFHFFNLEKMVRQKVETDFAKWAVKDEFETSAQYRERIQNKDQAIEKLTLAAIDHFKKKFLEKVDFSDFVVHPYDADAETFKISLNKLGDFYLYVPLEQAREFKENAHRLRFKNIDLKIRDNNWVLSYLDVYDTYTYETFSYDITKAADYNPVIYDPKITGVNVELPEWEGDVAYDRQVKAPIKKTFMLGEPDVDVKVPVTDKSNKNTFAIIIGNEDYTRYNPNLNSDSNVDFARRDAQYFKEYATKTLGIPADNIAYLNDAISAQMNREISRILKMAKIRNGKVVMYYAGHGFPDPSTKDAYLMPVDVTAEDVKNQGILLSDLYEQLADEGIAQATVFLDACFSGGGRKKGLMEGARFAKIKPNRIKLKGKIVVFSASSGAQVSKSYDEMQHGIFTYFLLKKLKETKGEVSYGELFEYLGNEVSFTAAKFYSDQQPDINTSLEVDEAWKEWRF